MEHFSAEHIERQGHGRDRTGLLPDFLGEMVEDIQDRAGIEYMSRKLCKAFL